jgi:hypothetical protein
MLKNWVLLNILKVHYFPLQIFFFEFFFWEITHNIISVEADKVQW